MERTNFTATTNACKLCTPLGAALVFRGIYNCVPILHGSQGCSTYIRRYLISHFKEPIDIASSNFTEESAIFGGRNNLIASIKNVSKQYEPDILGIATTCLSETIGEDLTLMLANIETEFTDEKMPVIVNVSTPSYSGTHIDGFHSAVKAMIQKFAQFDSPGEHVNIFPGMVSPADIRYLKEIFEDFGIKGIILPDYSDTLDGGPWNEYQKIPEGGTTIEEMELSGSAKATIEIGKTLLGTNSAGRYLEEFGSVPLIRFGLPIGINETDKLVECLEELSGCDLPEKHNKERLRLIDSYADGHKYVFGAKAVVYGEEDLVVSIAQFLAETGIDPVVCASGGNTGKLSKLLKESLPAKVYERCTIKSGADFIDIEELIKETYPDFIIGNSKGYTTSRKLNIPLIRIGFPVHDRFGGQRILHLGYRGTQQLFDLIVNTMIEIKQNASPVGYTYM